jgi:hypothetical protein
MRDFGVVLFVTFVVLAMVALGLLFLVFLKAGRPQDPHA